MFKIGIIDYTVGVANGLLNNLSAYYKSDTNGSFPDAHSTNDGTINGATYTASGKINGGYSYDGVNDNVLNGDSVLSDTAGSVSVWFKPDTTSTGYIFASSNSGNSRVYIYQNGAEITFARGDQGAIATGVNVTIGQWYHCVLTWDGTNYTTYVNAVNKNNGTYTIINAISAWFGLGSFNQNGASASTFFDGTIDEIGIWDKVLDSDDVTALYDSGAGLPYGDFTT